jgi:phosphoribosylformimino-5-aminoimidazole carboxamide ribotide isomerase
MILFPAIDLKEGRCVRLRQGDMTLATIFNPDPADQARRFAEAGAEWLHLVDLDGAFAGRPVNGAAVEAIIRTSGLSCQLGGGIRDLPTIERWLARGVGRVILGTAALKHPDLVRDAAKSFPGRIAVGIDARRGRVAVEGWAEESEISASDLALRFEDAGVAAIIFTDIDRDGLSQGLNTQATVALASRLKVPVIASGGVAGMADLDRLLRLAPGAAAKGGGIMGVVAGRALYDGGLDLRAAILRLKEKAPC